MNLSHYHSLVLNGPKQCAKLVTHRRYGLPNVIMYIGYENLPRVLEELAVAYMLVITHYEALQASGLEALTDVPICDEKGLVSTFIHQKYENRTSSYSIPFQTCIFNFHSSKVLKTGPSVTAFHFKRAFSIFSTTDFGH